MSVPSPETHGPARCMEHAAAARGKELSMNVHGLIIPFAGDLSDDAVRTSCREAGWLPCDGAYYEQGRFPRLYDVLGDRYRTDAPDTFFNVPDLRARFPFGADPELEGRELVEGTRVATRGGRREVQLAIENLPPHSHGYWRIHSAGTVVDKFERDRRDPEGIYRTQAQTASAGEGLAFEILPPFLALNWLIFAGPPEGAA